MSPLPMMPEATARPRIQDEGRHNGSTFAAAEGVECRHCHGSNPGSRKFCGHCGKSLWEPCPKCKTEGPATEKFCGSCGANIVALHQERIEKFEADLARAEALRAAGDYEGAIGLVASLGRLNSIRFEVQIERARGKLAEITAERDGQSSVAAVALAKGRELQAAHAYETAVSVLEEIPACVRSDEFKTFYEQVRSQWQEVLALGGEIRQLLEEKRTLEMLPKLDRLIQLQPEHAQAKVLAGQLRDRYVQAVKKKLAANLYREALALARDIPALVRTPEVEDLQVQAAELTWLLDDLTTAPAVDKVLPAVAERLLKFAPTNEQAKKLLAQMQERAKTKPKDPRIALPLWAAAPEKTRLGLPVDWLGGFSRLKTRKDVSAETTAALAGNPGCLFVAAGLALQGVEKSALALNLVPKPKTANRFVGLLKSDILGKKKKPPLRQAWGLDLTESGLKAVKLVCDEQGENPEISACEVYEHKRSLGAQDAQAGQADYQAATLKSFLERHDLTGCKVCASLETAKMLARFLQLPPIEVKQIPDMVEYEAKHQIPVPLTELKWDYELLGPDVEDKASDSPRRVLILAAKEHLAKNRLAAFAAAGIEVDVLQSDAVALYNLALYEFFEKQPAATERPTALALADVGSESTNVVIAWPGGIWFRGIRCGGEDLSKALVRQFKLSHAQAEQLKRDPTKARRLAQLYEALDPQFSVLADEIERSLAAFHNERQGVTVQRLLAVGGAMRTHGLWKYFRSG